MHMDGISSGPMYGDVLLNIGSICVARATVMGTTFWSTKCKAKCLSFYFLVPLIWGGAYSRCSRQLSMAKRPGDPPLILEDNMLRVRALELQIKRGERDAHDTIMAAGFFGGGSIGALALWTSYVVASAAFTIRNGLNIFHTLASVSSWGTFDPSRSSTTPTARTALCLVVLAS